MEIPLFRNQSDFLHELSRNSNAGRANIAIVCEIEGQLDDFVLDEAVRLLIKSSESLRTRLIGRDDHFAQCVGTEQLTTVFKKASYDAVSARKWLEYQVTQKFTILEEPLYRLGLVRVISERKNYFILVAHPILLSWASLSVLAQRFIAFYNQVFLSYTPVSKCPTLLSLMQAESVYLQSPEYEIDRNYFSNLLSKWRPLEQNKTFVADARIFASRISILPDELDDEGGGAQPKRDLAALVGVLGSRLAKLFQMESVAFEIMLDLDNGFEREVVSPQQSSFLLQLGFPKFPTGRNLHEYIRGQIRESLSHARFPCHGLSISSDIAVCLVPWSQREMSVGSAQLRAVFPLAGGDDTALIKLCILADSGTSARCCMVVDANFDNDVSQKFLADITEHF